MSIRVPKIPVVYRKQTKPRKCIDCPALIRLQRGSRCKPCQDEHRSKVARENSKEKYQKRKQRKLLLKGGE